MTPEEAYELTLEVVSNHLVESDPDGGWGEAVPEEDARAFCIGEAAAYLADLDMMPDVRRAALRGIVAGARAAGHPDLFTDPDVREARGKAGIEVTDEKMLADAVAEELNTAL